MQQTATASRFKPAPVQPMRVGKTQTGHVIERGVPIPVLAPVWQRGEQNRGRPASVDLSSLHVNDSIFIAGKTRLAIQRARMNAYNAAKRSEIKVTVRSVDGGVRVWRVA